MLSDFNLIKSCFGDDDEQNDSEKFEIRNKKERKVYYNPHFAQTQVKKKKEKRNKLAGYNSEINEKPFFTPQAPTSRKMTLDCHPDLQRLLLSDIKEVNSDFGIEYDFGNKEYKLKLCDVNSERIEGLVTQMKFRLEEGRGECFYEIGVEDNGNPLGLPMEELEVSVDTLKRVVEKLNATATVTKLHKGKMGLIAEVMIKQKEDVVKNDKLEIKIGLLGEEGSGKSTLIGVLVSNKLDNGKGLARYNVFRHKHEILCGKTSSISHQILGFDENGDLTNYGSLEKPSWAQIVNKSAKILNFYDMGGSNKNFTKTMTTFSPNYLDYLLLVISAEIGITETTQDFLNFSTNMNLPIITVFTKIDLITEDKKKELIQNFKAMINEMKYNRLPIIIKSNDDVVLFSRNIQEKSVIPLFLVSNVDWEGLNLMKNFLSMLPVTDIRDELKSIEKEKLEFDIHETLAIDSKIIITGIINKGKLITGANCYLGPDNEGRFKIVEVVNIHCKKIPVNYVYRGQYCSILIMSDPGIKRDEVRKGMVLLDINSSPYSTKIFEADLWTIDGTKKVIKYKYQPVLNIKHIRQGCKIRNRNELNYPEAQASINSEALKDVIISSEFSENKTDVPRTKRTQTVQQSRRKYSSYEPEPLDMSPVVRVPIQEDSTDVSISQDSFILCSTQKTNVEFEFMFNPEYLTVGSHIIINDQLIKAYGIITKICK